MCVCVCERESERKRDGERGRESVGVRWREMGRKRDRLRKRVCAYACLDVRVRAPGKDIASHSVRCQVWLCELTLIIVFTAHSHHRQL